MKKGRLWLGLGGLAIAAAVWAGVPVLRHLGQEAGLPLVNLLPDGQPGIVRQVPPTAWLAPGEGDASGPEAELGKDPGLGIRALHSRGINGSGVSIGIIDGTLYTGHQDYSAQLRHYEELHIYNDTPEMHGSAVSSLAVGTQCGVAPGAALYYIAAYPMDGYGDPDYTPLAQAIDRMLALNTTLPPQDKIRVIAISHGYRVPWEKGVGAWNAAIRRAGEQGVLVLNTNMAHYPKQRFAGAGRPPLADPNLRESYTAGVFMQQRGVDKFADRLLVPMDNRTFAAPSGTDRYTYQEEGGFSWCTPWLAGLYALGVQVYPELSPQIFLDMAFATAGTIEVTDKGKLVQMPYLADPEKLIEALSQFTAAK